LTECGWAETAMAGNSLTEPYKAWERFRRRSQHSRRDPPEIHTGRDGAAGDWTACVGQTEHFTALACTLHTADTDAQPTADDVPSCEQLNRLSIIEGSVTAAAPWSSALALQSQLLVY
jgi:hypothetical protein